MRTTLVGMLQMKCTYVEVKKFKRQNRNSAINYHTEKKRRRSKLKKNIEQRPIKNTLKT